MAPARKFAALPGLYETLFLHLEPASEIIPALLIWFFPGATWFHHGLIPSSSAAPPAGFMDGRTAMAIWQLGNCYLLIGLLATFAFRAIRDALAHDPATQERLIGASLTAMAIADITHILATLIALPPDLRYAPLSWNPVTHGNISIVAFLFLARLAWFAGLGRTRYYYGQNRHAKTS